MNNSVRNNLISSKCTICYKITEDIYQHSLLKVVICKDCFVVVDPILNEPEVTNCIWCTRNKEMLQCARCNYKCCYDCINSNLGLSYLNCVNEKNWLCFFCESMPIETMQQEYVKLNSLMKNDIEPLIPEGASSSIDISSPFVIVDESDNINKKFHRKSHTSQDLDAILSTFEKQMKASLELEDSNVPAIISEINSITTDQLSVAIHCFKKCMSAFSSDISNLESRVTDAMATNNHSMLHKLTSLMRILIQHHIFNRLSHPIARIREDLSPASKDRSANNLIPHDNSSNQKLVVILDEKWLKNGKDSQKLKLAVGKVSVNLNETKSKDFTISDLSRIINTCAKSGAASKRSSSADGNSSKGSYKRPRMYDEESIESIETKAERARRSLNTPSWLSDFKIEKENDDTIAAVDEKDDHEWTDYRFRDEFAPRKRGRPRKYFNFHKSFPSGGIGDDSENELPKRTRGRPKKVATLNDKQPRFYIPKLNGETLLSIKDDV